MSGSEILAYIVMVRVRVREMTPDDGFFGFYYFL
jgi:hypothetical protein